MNSIQSLVGTQRRKQVTDKEGQKAEKSTMLSENEELLAATQAQLKIDEDFFATARDQCKAKSDEWDERSRLRTEQLDGIEKALEILTSDEARKTFAASAVRPQDTFGTEGERGRLGSHRLEVRNRK